MSAKIERLCRKAEFRRRLARGARLGLWISGGAALAAAIALAAARALGLEFSDTFFAAAPAVVGAGSFIATVAFARRPLGEVALLLEERHGLKSRLSTALALKKSEWAGPEIAGAVIQDAEARLEGVDPGAVTDWRLRPPLFMSAGAMTALMLTLMFFPQMDLLKKRAERKRQEAEAAARVEEAKALKKLAEELKAPTMALGREPFHMRDELEKLVEDLKNPKLSQTQAMLQVSDMRQKLQQQRERLKNMEPKLNPSKAAEMESPAAAKLARELTAAQYAEASKTATEIAESIQSKDGDPAEKKAELDKLQRDFEKLAEAMKNRPDLAQKFNAAAANLKKEMTEDAAREMRELARDLGELSALKEANKELDKADKALKQAQKNLGNPGQQDKSSEDAQGSESEQEGQEGQENQDGQDSQDGQNGEENGASENESASKESSSESREKSSSKMSGLNRQKAGDFQEQNGEPGEASEQEFQEAQANELEQWDGKQEDLKAARMQQGQKGEKGQKAQQASGECEHGKKAGECTSGTCSGKKSGATQVIHQGGKASSGWGKTSGNYDTQAAVLGQGKQENRYSNEQRRADEREFMNRMRESQMNPNLGDSRVRGRRGDGPMLGQRSVPVPAEHQTPTTEIGPAASPVEVEKRSLDQQDIPLDYRPSVRRYFDSIEVPKN